MPSSSPDNLSIPIAIACKLSPASVLDLGIGYGKYGVLFREYLELIRRWHDGEESFADLSRRTVRIDGVEAFPHYIGTLQRCTYDNIFVENILDFVQRGLHYDFIYMGDVLEHFDKKEAAVLLPRIVSLANMGALISVPANPGPQSAIFGNEFEIHRSRWSKSDFRAAAPYSLVGVSNGSLLAFLTNNHSAYRTVRGNPLRTRLRVVKRTICEHWWA